MGAQTLQQQAGLLHGRQMVLLVTIGLHALVIALLMTMKMGGIDVFNQPSIKAVFLPQDRVEPPPRPDPLKPVMKTPTFERIPVPDPVFQQEAPPTVIDLPQADPGPVTQVAEGPPTGSVAQIPSTALQFSVVRSTDDYYPSQSLSMNEQGTAIVRVCVTPGGKLDGRPAIEGSSGSPRLDAAALNWAREALRFKPATQNGVAVAACKGFRVTFQLH